MSIVITIIKSKINKIIQNYDDDCNDGDIHDNVNDDAECDMIGKMMTMVMMEIMNTLYLVHTLSWALWFLTFSKYTLAPLSRPLVQLHRQELPSISWKPISHKSTLWRFCKEVYLDETLTEVESWDASIASLSLLDSTPSVVQKK